VIPVLPHNINAISKSKLPVLMYFWGANCSSCKTFMPIVEKVAKQCRGKYRFASVFVPKNVALAKRYRVRGIPSFVLLKKGKQQAFVNGGLRQKELLQWLAAN
jgi:thioredoxin 2